VQLVYKQLIDAVSEQHPEIGDNTAANSIKIYKLFNVVTVQMTTEAVIQY